VQTVAGKFWFPYFRLYAPNAAYRYRTRLPSSVEARVGEVSGFVPQRTRAWRHDPRVG
jgi:hypothetical protein